MCFSLVLIYVKLQTTENYNMGYLMCAAGLAISKFHVASWIGTVKTEIFQIPQFCAKFDAFT